MGSMTATLAVAVGFLIYAAVDSHSIPRATTPFELEDFLSGAYGQETFSGTWISGTEFYYKSDGNVVRHNVATNEETVLLEKAVLDNYAGASVTISPDQQYALIGYNSSSVFRHSTKSIFVVINLATKQAIDLHNQELLSTAQFDTAGHTIIYVYQNNIYYMATPESLAQEITSDGIPDVYYNGVPDWVYEEEVLSSGSAMWLSPDGKKIAYASFDDTNVRNFTYTLYEDSEGKSTQYPTEVTIKYPKVGTANPIVRLFIYDLEEKKRLEPKVPQTDKADYILYDVAWINDNEISLATTNRIQNKSELTQCSAVDERCNLISTTETTGWIEPRAPVYSADGTKRLEILPQAEDGDYFDHLVLIDGSTSTRLTKGKRVVTQIYSWDEKNDLIYYSATGENAPSTLYVNSVSSTGTDTCITCDKLSQTEPCTYGAGSFSTDSSHFVHACRGPNPAYVTIEKSPKTTLKVWKDNAALVEKLTLKDKIQILQEEVPLEDGLKARVKLLLPSDFNPNQAYPTLVNVYAGPNSNQISDVYSVGFQNYLVTKKKVIYVYIDGRGSGKDGQNKLFKIYKKLSTVEIEDQIAVMKYLQDKYTFIDRLNTAIWGWSYGGFATAWALAKDTGNVFKCGISVAPVVDFIYYDTIYTERYMGLPTPDDNEIGYANNDVTKNVENIRNKSFYLIHGNADDNVHYQQSMLLARALELNDILFKQQSYPEENHSLGHVSQHLYHSMDLFWDQCFASNQLRQTDLLRTQLGNIV